MSNIYNLNDVSFDISSLAVKAIIYEVSCYPSPGLVSPISNGAHKDMNYYSFIDSTASLIKYLTLCVQEGLNGYEPKSIFVNLRKLGIDAEKNMFDATGGVNTHKGMLFLMGISCAAVGYAIKYQKTFKDISGIIKEMTNGIVSSDFKNLYKKDKRSLTYGEKLYLKYGIKGIRGEVEKGLPIIFNFGLEFYKNCSDLNKNDRLIHTLIGILQFNEDTNIIHRHSIEILKEVNIKAKNIISIGGMYTKKGRIQINLLSKEFIDKNISPGGTADVLAVTVFLTLVKKYLMDFRYN